MGRERNLGMKTIMEIKEAQFEALVLNEALPVAVFFYAPWSQHCEVMEPVMEAAAHAAGNKAKFFRVNVSKNTDLSGWYGVECIPTLLYFRGGKIADRILGTATKEEVLLKFGVGSAECGIRKETPNAEGEGEDGGPQISGCGLQASSEEESEDGGWRMVDARGLTEETSNIEHRISNLEGRDADGGLRMESARARIEALKLN